MNTPPATCPACGAGLRQPLSNSSKFYECGVGYLTENPDGTGDWFRLEDLKCRNAFDTAVQLRQENEWLNKQLMELSVEYGKLKSQFGSRDTQPEETKE